MATTKPSKKLIEDTDKQKEENRKKQQEKLKEDYKKIVKERIKLEMENYTDQNTGKKGLQKKQLAEHLGVDPTLISKWITEKNSQPVKDYQLQAMAGLFHCEKSWLEGGNARTHEHYNSVIERTGLSENAIQFLIDNKNEYQFHEDAKEYIRSKGTLINDEPCEAQFITEAVNGLLTSGTSLIEAISDYIEAKPDYENAMKEMQESSFSESEIEAAELIFKHLQKRKLNWNIHDNEMQWFCKEYAKAFPKDESAAISAEIIYRYLVAKYDCNLKEKEAACTAALQELLQKL